MNARVIDEGLGPPVVHVDGELTRRDADLLRRIVAALIADEPEEVIIDLRGCTFLDEHGLAALLAARSHAERSFVSLGLVPGPRPVQRKFEATGTGRVFRFVER